MTQFIVLSSISLLKLKCSCLKAIRQPSASLEGELLRRRSLKIHLDNREPQHELLGLHSCHLLHLLWLDECGHLGGVRHLALDLLESVVLILLLCYPHEAGCTIVAKLLDVLHGEQARRHAELCEQLDDLLLALGVAMADLCTCSIALNGLRCHLTLSSNW